MIKKFINKLLGKASPAAKSPFGKREEIGPEVHGINPQLVDERAQNVLRTLKTAGFEAFIVGGAVRDMMLGLAPKDFDVATNATPEQVKNLFRRAFIIGRRFRIVHVIYGRGCEHEVIEVSTFRAYLDNAAAEQVAGNEKTSKGDLADMQHAVDSTGRVLRDNVWGPQEEDAARRDFTINAMYYDPETQIVVDYHHGIQDAKALVIRMIGDAATRYREDPVRIIRAVRFAAKLHGLGFKLEPKTATPLIKSRELLAEVPQSRLFDEMLKLLQTGHSLASIAELKELGMAQGIYPLLDVVVERADTPFVKSALQDTDRRVAEGKPVAPSFLLACVLWSDVRDGWRARMNNQQHPHPALQDAIEDTFNARIGDVSGRGRLAGDMREIWQMQPRFEKRVGSAAFGLAEQPRFRAAFDFMRLRAENGELDEVLSDWWEQFSLADDNLRRDMIDEVKQEQQQRARPTRPPRPNKAAMRQAGQPPFGPADTDQAVNPPASALGNQAIDGALGPNPDAPKKRRRRRRNPGSSADRGDASGSLPDASAA
ncbi:MAG: polynucleotide adenylyltransferase PcnB [Rhodoferax sp.]|jgi:poly(A) polymerase|nr:polynucleotide adenylyltransferase PcnB [Rhodoferax sp.]